MIGNTHLLFIAVNVVAKPHPIKMIIIHHNKDMDGYCSGAICKLKYPDAKLIGWDYKDEIPDFKQFVGEDVIMIDITFPIDKIKELARISRLTVIDHHISFLKDILKEDYIDHPDPASITEFIKTKSKVFEKAGDFNYIYKANTAACEIGWGYLFPDKPIPYAVTLIGRYDTWRQSEGDWQNETLPFKYYMYGQCNSAEGFPHLLLDQEWSDPIIGSYIKSGYDIMKYQDMIDEAGTRAFSFEREAYGARAIILNQTYFNSESVKSKYDPEKHDIMVGFCYTGTKWSVSLRSAKPEFDVSVIAKARGGGGHKGAAGFEVQNFEDIFK